MKLSYVLQMRDFTILLIAGFILGIIFSVLSAPSFTRTKLPIKIPMDLIFTLIFAIVFIEVVNQVNMGEFRLFLIIAYLSGIILELRTLGKLFAKGNKWVYNRLINLCKHIKESRLGKVIFK